MFNFKKKKEANNLENTDNRDAYKDFKEEMQKFGEYDSLSEVPFDECFWFIYRNMKKDIKDTLIIASYLRQIEVPLEEIKKVYSLDDEYIENLISNEIPSLRVKAYKRLKEELPNETVAFFPGFHNNFEPLYIELIDRIEYLFEVKKNQKKIRTDLGDNEIISSIISNPAVLVLLNYFSVKESLILASNLDLLSIDEDIIHQIYTFNENDFRNIFESVNITYIEDLLTKRIEKLNNIEMETSFFDYQELSDKYEDLLNRINDTKKYLSGTKKR